MMNERQETGRRDELTELDDLDAGEGPRLVHGAVG
jgi:hypothetical protein